MASKAPNGTVAGIDIGSRSIELVVLHNGELVHQAKVPTTFDPLSQSARLLEGVSAGSITATGYGRRLFADAHSGNGRVSTVTEIQAYALGASHLFPEARSVIDIGGQDTKAIVLSDRGTIVKFEMNDRCAAGTGKFLEFMATALQVPLEGFGRFALRSAKRIQISSMCTVFAESEATSLMARGESPEDIAMGLHHAVVQRTLSMLHRVGVRFPLLFAGGVAWNPCIRKLLEDELGEKLIVPAPPDMVGAIGAAIHCGNSQPGAR